MKLSKVFSITKPLRRIGSKLLSWLGIRKQVNESDIIKLCSLVTQSETSSSFSEYNLWQHDSSYDKEFMGMAINPQNLQMFTGKDSDGESESILTSGESFIRVETDGEEWSEADEFSLPGYENEMIDCGYRALQDTVQRRYAILLKRKLERERAKREEIGLPRNPPVVNGRLLRR